LPFSMTRWVQVILGGMMCRFVTSTAQKMTTNRPMKRRGAGKDFQAVGISCLIAGAANPKRVTLFYPPLQLANRAQFSQAASSLQLAWATDHHFPAIGRDMVILSAGPEDPGTVGSRQGRPGVELHTSKRVQLIID
jgi:hypothetical protein